MALKLDQNHAHDDVPDFNTFWFASNPIKASSLGISNSIGLIDPIFRGAGGVD